MYELIEQSVAYFHEQLFTNSAEIARVYLNSRKITDETINIFRLGYCPHGSKIEPRFSGRVIFPICDAQNRTVGWTARDIEGNTDGPKYMNTSDSPYYKKGRLLFPLQLAKSALRHKNWGILVEGQMDAIRLYQSGVHNVVATSGTYLKLEQALLLSRYCDRVFTVFDADNAGDTAHIKNKIPLEEAGLKVRSVKLPAGEDPDSFVLQYGVDAFLTLLQESVKGQ